MTGYSLISCLCWALGAAIKMVPKLFEGEIAVREGSIFPAVLEGRQGHPNNQYRCTAGEHIRNDSFLNLY